MTPVRYLHDKCNRGGSKTASRNRSLWAFVGLIFVDIRLSLGRLPFASRMLVISWAKTEWRKRNVDGSGNYCLRRHHLNQLGAPRTALIFATEVELLMVPFVPGFMAGYGTRGYVSYQRRKRAHRL